MRILFVCTGNTCRSPMAEALLKEIAEEKNLELQVKSAGIFAPNGQEASRHAVEVIGNEDILNHKSKVLTEELMDWAELVLVMTKSHLKMVEDMYPEKSPKTHLLLDFAEYEDKDVADPYGGSLKDYKRVKVQLEDAIFALLDKIYEEEI